MTKKIDDLVGDLEVRAKELELSENPSELQKEIIRLRKIIESYGLSEEMHITNIEYICQIGIDNLKGMAMQGSLTQDEAKTLDILHKNLRIARGKLEKKEVPGRETSEAELLKIVKNEQ